MSEEPVLSKTEKPAMSDRPPLEAGPASSSGVSSSESTPPETERLDPDAPEWISNRELSWLQFNRRVLAQAADERIPLLERVKFLAISGSNLDEFFMKRIGGLKQQVAARVQEVSVDGRTPAEQIEACYADIHEYQAQKDEVVAQVWADLHDAGIVIVDHADLSDEEADQVRQDYFDNIFPLVTPQSVDPAHPFPFISNLSLNLLVSLRYPQDKELSLARVKVPVSAGAPRFIQVGDGHRYVFLEEVMSANLDLLFPGMEVVDCGLFRVTRNANTERTEEHADDLLAMIESSLQDRKFAPIVRLQVRNDIDPMHRGRLAAELGLDAENDVFQVDGIMGLHDLWQIVRLQLPELKDPVHHPVDHPSLQSQRNIFHVIRELRSVLLQHPYEDFSSSVERFLREAATDPKVRGIKMTLYRTDPDSRIIDHLIRAARNGKQVAVVVELTASFDEESNIRLANRMEEAGIHVTYGVIGLKTHAKVILVIRQDYKGLRRYVHIGTGNYHPGTARLYCDLGLLLYDKDIGQDTTELFNYLTTGYTPKRNYRKMLVAPKMIKRALLGKIDREIEHFEAGKSARIQFKMNALEDVDIARALYRASQAGVKVDLIIRDSCRIRPGIKGLSETIRVISVVGQFLEHSRIYYFRNAGQDEYLIGSADAMKRNLEHRVEVLVPVEDPQLCQDLRTMLDSQWHDQRNAWELQSDGCYLQRQPTNDMDNSSCQQTLISLAEKRLHDVTRLRKRKAKGVGSRNLLD